MNKIPLTREGILLRIVLIVQTALALSILPVPMAACVAGAAVTDPAPMTATQPYVWKNVRMEGMGFVTGVVVHPKQPGLVYIRTDVGGCYRWNAQTRSWIPLMDGFDLEHWPGGLESIAIDPQNPNTVYAAGTFCKTADIYRSGDRGTTWAPLGLRTSTGKAVVMAANGEYRGAGERLAVSPSNSASIFFGSRSDGLFHSADAGKTWSHIDSLPNSGTAKFGVTFVQFSVDGKLAYAGVAGAGVYRSADDGGSWSLLAAAPSADAFPCRAAVASNGDVYVTFASVNGNAGGLYKIGAPGVVTDVTPEGKHRGYVGVTVDPHDPTRVATFCGSFSVQTLFVSRDGAATWAHSHFKYTVPGWWARYELAADGAFGYSSALVLDPTQPGSAWAADGFGAFHTADLFAENPVWTAEMNNLEELVVLALTSPSTGAPLISGTADMHGFRHADLDAVPDKTLANNVFGDTESLDFCEAHPNVIVRAGGGENDGKASNGYSTDGGATWRSFANFPSHYNNGKVAISATDPNLIIWAPESNHWDRNDPLNTVYPVRSVDGGQTWQPVEGAQRNQGVLGMWFGSTPLAADRVDGNLFYFYEMGDNVNGKWHGPQMRRSMDGGAHWQVTCTSLPQWYEVSVKTVPGFRGDVWLSCANGRPLVRSVDAGVTFNPVPRLDKVWQFAFGKNKPGVSYPSVYVLAVIDGQEGLFRSDDLLGFPPSGSASAHWVRVNGEEGFGGATCMVGDRQVYGRVYVGAGGRGILYGTIDPKTTLITARP
ncbi:MAG: hypothetical protein P4L33_03555 [Capsulimonadaceae bacterium]|nr:hypothetical protein [Capsulimonadaceae bacterium]